MNDWVTGGSVLGIALVAVNIADAASDTVHTRLDRLPHQLIRIAEQRLDNGVRSDITAEWTAELDAILRRHDRRPLPLIRLIIGLRFAAGLLRTAKITNRHLTANPHTTPPSQTAPTTRSPPDTSSPFSPSWPAPGSHCHARSRHSGQQATRHGNQPEPPGSPATPKHHAG